MLKIIRIGKLNLPTIHVDPKRIPVERYIHEEGTHLAVGQDGAHPHGLAPMLASGQVVVVRVELDAGTGVQFGPVPVVRLLAQRVVRAVVDPGEPIYSLLTLLIILTSFLALRSTTSSL